MAIRPGKDRGESGAGVQMGAWACAVRNGEAVSAAVKLNIPEVSAIQIGPSVEDAIVEHCVIGNNERGIVTNSKAGSVLLRENRFSGVMNPLTIGDPSKTLVIESTAAPSLEPIQRSP